MNGDHYLAHMSDGQPRGDFDCCEQKRPVQVPASNSESRRRAQRQAHPDPAVRELLERAWDDGYGAAYLFERGAIHPEIENPYRSES